MGSSCCRKCRCDCEPPIDWKETFEHVTSAEEEHSERRQKGWKEERVTVSENSIGVCCSGGGIRAANLSLGLLWRLAELDLLKEVSHFSAVSGGAYATAALATTCINRWPERERTQLSQEESTRRVNRWYREVVAETVMRFQDNSNHLLMPFRCLRGNTKMRRVAGICCLCSLFFFMLILHPLSLGIFIMVPLLMYFHTFHTALMRYTICAPPFECKDQTCKELAIRPTDWQYTLEHDLGYDNALWWITAIFIVTLSIWLLRLFGVHQWLDPNSGGSKASQQCFRLRCWHLLNGLEAMFSRLAAVVGAATMLTGLALYTQHLNYGNVDDIFWTGHTLRNASAGRASGWTFHFNLTDTSFPVDLDSQPFVVRFATWYTCYNYSMSQWQDKGWLGQDQTGGLTGVGHHWHHRNRHEKCFDKLDEPNGVCRMDNHMRNGLTSLWYGECSFGAFYWGYSGHVGRAEQGIGPRDLTRRAYYQKWYDTCQNKQQIMCFSPSHVGTEAVAGCCSSMFPIVGTVGIVGLALIALFPWLLWKDTTLLKLMLFTAGPLLALTLLAFALIWRVFGPIVQSPSATGLGEPLIGQLLPYTFETWQIVLWVSVILAIVLLPFFDVLQRVVHVYFRSSIVNAYFHNDSENKTLEDCAHNLPCPLLLFGSTILMHRESYDEDEGFGSFCMSTFHFGSRRTRYFKAPQNFEIAQAVGCSGAAVDTALLIAPGVANWVARFWVLSLNLMQGDWLRLLPYQEWGSQAKTESDRGGMDQPLTTRPSSQREGRRRHCWYTLPIRRFRDSLPGLFIFEACFLLALGAESLNTRGMCEHGNNCMAIAYLIQGLMFCFIFLMPLCQSWMYLFQPSPLVRMMQMALVAAPVTDKEGGVPPYVYLGDGGLLENSGCLELLRREKRLIIVMEAGDDQNLEMVVLRNLIELAEKEHLCGFFNTEDPRKSLKETIEEYQRDASQTYLHLGILYGWNEKSDETGQDVESNSNKVCKRIRGDLFWIQNRTSSLTKGQQWGLCKWRRRSSDRAAAEEVRDDSSAAESRYSEDGTMVSFEVTGRQQADSQQRDASPGSSLNSDLELTAATTTSNPPLSELRSFCWDDPCCGVTCSFPCGDFPHVETVNQFFSPKMAANFFHYGYHLSEGAVAELKKFFPDEKIQVDRTS